MYNICIILLQLAIWRCLGCHTSYPKDTTFLWIFLYQLERVDMPKTSCRYLLVSISTLVGQIVCNTEPSAKSSLETGEGHYQKIPGRGLDEPAGLSLRITQHIAQVIHLRRWLVPTNVVRPQVPNLKPCETDSCVIVIVYLRIQEPGKVGVSLCTLVEPFSRDSSHLSRTPCWQRHGMGRSQRRGHGREVGPGVLGARGPEEAGVRGLQARRGGERARDLGRGCVCWWSCWLLREWWQWSPGAHCSVGGFTTPPRCPSSPLRHCIFLIVILFFIYWQKEMYIFFVN